MMRLDDLDPTNIERLRAALRPFAKISLWRDTYPDAKSDRIMAQQMQGYIKVEDVRAARAALYYIMS